MFLDTSVRQAEARSLYASLGFEEVAPYYDVPDDVRDWLVFSDSTCDPRGSGPSTPVRRAVGGQDRATTPGGRTSTTRIEREMASNNAGAAGGGAIYGLGIFGAWVYFWQQADGFWEYAFAIVQGLFWPAFMVYEAFSAMAA